MKPETIKELLDKGMNSTRLVEVLNQDADIRGQLNYLEGKLEELEKKYLEDMSNVKKQIKAIRDNCPHFEKTWVPDASGNNGSYYYCNSCGKEL